MQDWGDKYSSDEDMWATEDEDYEGNESDSSSQEEYYRSRSVSDSYTLQYPKQTILQVFQSIKLGTIRSDDATATKTSEKKNRQNNHFARALHLFVHFFAVFARLWREIA